MRQNGTLALFGPNPARRSLAFREKQAISGRSKQSAAIEFRKAEKSLLFMNVF